MLAVCDYILSQDTRHLDTVAQIDSWLLELQRPDIFDDGDARNVLVNTRRSFGSLCAALAENGFPAAGQLTTFQFQSAVDRLIEKHKPRD